MGAYARGELGEVLVPLPECHRIIAIGSDRMMAAVKDARHGVLAQHFQPGHVAIASINSPMQCMMKEICAQCLQRHIDPATGKETIVFSCSNQDQPQDFVDWKNLADRLRQNTVQEKLTDLWVRRLLATPREPAVGARGNQSPAWLSGLRGYRPFGCGNDGSSSREDDNRLRAGGRVPIERGLVL